MMNEKLNTLSTGFCDLTEVELTNIDGGVPVFGLVFVAGIGFVIGFISGSRR